MIPQDYSCPTAPGTTGPHTGLWDGDHRRLTGSSDVNKGSAWPGALWPPCRVSQLPALVSPALTQPLASCSHSPALTSTSGSHGPSPASASRPPGLSGPTIEGSPTPTFPLFLLTGEQGGQAVSARGGFWPLRGVRKAGGGQEGWEFCFRDWGPRSLRFEGGSGQEPQGVS